VDRFGSDHWHRLAKGLSSYILGTGSGRTDGRNVYRVKRRVQMTMALVRGHNYGGICRCSTVPTMVWEGGVRIHPLNSEPKVG